jgi:uncharacterized protein YggE
VTIEDLSMIGNVVDLAVQNGVNYVSNVQFTSKNKEAIYQQSLSKALINAIEKAKTIATTLKVTLIPIPTLIVEGGNIVQPLHQPGTFVLGVSSTQFEPGQLLIKATVSAEFRYI